MTYCFLQKNIGFKLPIVIVFKLDIFFIIIITLLILSLKNKSNYYIISYILIRIVYVGQKIMILYYSKAIVISNGLLCSVVYY